MEKNSFTTVENYWFEDAALKQIIFFNGAAEEFRPALFKEKVNGIVLAVANGTRTFWR